MFDLVGVAFRFGNVVGPRQTHGVGFDFVRRLLAEPTELTILGDGSQSKSYVHVSDVIDAVLLAATTAPRPFAVFNVATGDYITVNEIAELAVNAVGLEPGATTFTYTGGNRGWRGDVPVVRLNTDRIRDPRLGQRSHHQAGIGRLLGRHVGRRPGRQAVVTSQPAVFMDRDGVINRAEVRNGVPRPPASIEDFELLPGVVEAVYRLRHAGFAVVIVTNQPDVARGDQRRSVVEAMNERVREAIEPDSIVVCYHDDADGCECRKPAPGMLLAAAEDLALDLTTSFMVGDRWRDIDAGRRAGCRTIFVDHGYEERRPEAPDAVVADLTEAVTWILTNIVKKQETRIA